MRLAENSWELVSIDGPDGGMAIPFLKDIPCVRQSSMLDPYKWTSLYRRQKNCAPQVKWYYCIRTYS